jgi:hypothetical protein
MTVLAVSGLVVMVPAFASAGAQTPTTEAPTTTESSPTTAAQGPHARREARVTRLAEALGVTVEELKEAGKAARDAVKASDASTPDERAQVRRDAFAEALGKSTAEVDQAIVDGVTARVDAAEAAGKISAEKAQQIRELAAQGPDALRGAARERLQERLAQRLSKAVEAGRITQEQADEITTRLEAGEPLRVVLRDLGLGRNGRQSQGG